MTKQKDKKNKKSKKRMRVSNVISICALLLSVASLVINEYRISKYQKESLKSKMQAVEKLGIDLAVALFISKNNNNSYEENNPEIIFRMNAPQSIVNQLGLDLDIETLFKAHIESPKSITIKIVFNRVSRLLNIDYKPEVADAFELSALITWNTLELRHLKQQNENELPTEAIYESNIEAINALILRLGLSESLIINSVDDITEESLTTIREELSLLFL